MFRKLFVLGMFLALILSSAAPVAAQGPNFFPSIYADGQAWGTKGLGSLPAPNGHNNQSFDMLFAFSNGAQGQLPVSEAGPGNPNYNGGRWWLHNATWDAGYLAQVGTPPVLTSYNEILAHQSAGHLTITDAQTYFLCPLLPVK